MSTTDIPRYWIEKAHDDLGSARDNFKSDRFSNAVRDSYFACFHAFSALLIKSGRTFKKHREVRAILHRDYIRTEKIGVQWGKHYDWLFDNRHKADYRPLVHFEADQVEEILLNSDAFVRHMSEYLKQENKEVEVKKE